MEQYNPFPRRIISLVPSQTELLYDLGLENEVIGITKFCIHPRQWFRTKTRIGGTKTVNIEKVRQLSPDLVIANKEENVKEQVEAIRKFAPVYVSDISSVTQALDMIKDIGSLTGKAEKATILRQQIAEQFARLKPGAGPRVAYFIWKDPWMTAGNDTFIHDIIRKAGWINVYENEVRYPTTSLPELAEKKPDIVLLSSEPYPFKEKHIKELRVFLPETGIILADGELFSWYGSRMQYAPGYILQLIDDIKGYQKYPK